MKELKESENIKGKDTLLKKNNTQNFRIESKKRLQRKESVCVCVSVGGGGGSNNQKKTKKIGMMRAGKRRTRSGGGRNKFGWLTKQLGKKISGEIYHLFMFVENGFRNSHYYCLMKYITMVMNPV